MEKSNLKHFIKLMTHYIQCHLEMHFRLYLKYFVQLFFSFVTLSSIAVMASYFVREMYFECVTKRNFNTVSDDFYKTSNQVRNTFIFRILFLIHTYILVSMLVSDKSLKILRCLTYTTKAINRPFQL